MSLQENFASDWLGVLGCAGRAVRDGAVELATIYTTGVLKKRDLWCSFTAKGVTPSERSSLLFAPLVKDSLFPQDIIDWISVDLQKRSTQDLITQSTKRTNFPARMSTATTRMSSPLQQHPFRGGRGRLQSRPRTNLRTSKPSTKPFIKSNTRK